MNEFPSGFRVSSLANMNATLPILALLLMFTAGGFGDEESSSSLTIEESVNATDRQLYTCGSSNVVFVNKGFQVFQANS